MGSIKSNNSLRQNNILLFCKNDARHSIATTVRSSVPRGGISYRVRQNHRRSPMVPHGRGRFIDHQLSHQLGYFSACEIKGDAHVRTWNVPRERRSDLLQFAHHRRPLSFPRFAPIDVTPRLPAATACRYTRSRGSLRSLCSNEKPLHLARCSQEKPSRSNAGKKKINYSSWNRARFPLRKMLCLLFALRRKLKLETNIVIKVINKV